MMRYFGKCRHCKLLKMIGLGNDLCLTCERKKHNKAKRRKSEKAVLRAYGEE